MSMPTPNKICPNACLYYVPGLGGINPDDFAEPFKVIRDSIFGGDFKSSETKVLKNRCQYALKTDVELKTEIKTLTKMHPNCKKYVSLVWFCHSHGASMVCQAYEELKNELHPEEFLSIFNKSAIICIGGSSLAKESFVKVVLNVEFENDPVAKGASSVYGAREGKLQLIGPLKDGSCMCCDGRKAAIKNQQGGVSNINFSSISSSTQSGLSRSSVNGQNGKNVSLLTCCGTCSLCGELNCCACKCCACCQRIKCCEKSCFGSRGKPKNNEIEFTTITEQPQSITTRATTVVKSAMKYFLPQENENPAHYIDDYILCNNWKIVVRSLLPRPKRKTCKIHCK